MAGSELIETTAQSLWLVVVLSAPVVLTALGVGLIVGLLQAATQVQEFTLSFVPKILAVLAVLGMTAPWMGRQLVAFAQAVMSRGF